MSGASHRGMSLIGLLATMAIMVILIAIAATAMQGVKGGSGTAIQQNQASTHADRQNLYGIGQGLFTFASSHNGRFPAPSAVSGREQDKDLDTTANFWSMMISLGYARPGMLISHNEASPNVEEYFAYNTSAYNPTTGLRWDPNFQADLHRRSHTSFGHMVLFGERFRRNWMMGGSSTAAVIGNRGPRDGINDPDSYACDATGVWAGNIFYAGGNIEFHTSVAPHGDNLFAIESGLDGNDSIIAFTKDMWPAGFDLQFD